MAQCVRKPKSLLQFQVLSGLAHDHVTATVVQIRHDHLAMLLPGSMCSPEAALLAVLWVCCSHEDQRSMTDILQQIPSCGAVRTTFELNICSYLAHHDVGSAIIIILILSRSTTLYAGRGQAFAGAGGGPMLLPVVEDWVKGVRSNLLQWSTRLLGQEQWQPYSSGQVSNCPFGFVTSAVVLYSLCINQ